MVKLLGEAQLDPSEREHSPFPGPRGGRFHECLSLGHMAPPAPRAPRHLGAVATLGRWGKSTGPGVTWPEFGFHSTPSSSVTLGK